MKDLIVVAVWVAAGLVVLGCAFAAWLGTSDWGDGGRARLSALDLVGLAIAAPGAVVVAVVITRRLGR